MPSDELLALMGHDASEDKRGVARLPRLCTLRALESGRCVQHMMLFHPRLGLGAQ